MDSFVEPEHPHVSTIVVRAPAPAERTVPLMGAHGINATSHKLINSTLALKQGLSQAGALAADGKGPVVLQLGPGWYGVEGAVAVPDGVTIAGAGMAKTVLMWQYQNASTAVPALITAAAPTSVDAAVASAAGAAAAKVTWGIRDLQITANTFYLSVINVTSATDGFKMQRTNIRANSFFCTSVTNARDNATYPLRPHEVPWGLDMLRYPNGQIVPTPQVVAIAGRNWEISDSDIYSSWGILGTQPIAEHAAYGLLARNKLYVGKGMAVGVDGSKQWIVEGNMITGTSVMAGGNSLATGQSQFAHHTYWGGNSLQFDWGP
jgi:hypothetical protein